MAELVLLLVSVVLWLRVGYSAKSAFRAHMFRINPGMPLDKSEDVFGNILFLLGPIGWLGGVLARRGE